MGPSSDFLIVTNDKCLLLHKKEFFSRPRVNCQFVVVLLAIFLYSFISMIIVHKGLWINREVSFWLTAIRYFIVGCVEEIVSFDRRKLTDKYKINQSVYSRHIFPKWDKKNCKCWRFVIESA